MSVAIKAVEKKIRDNESLSSADARFLLEEAPLHWLGQASAALRKRLHPSNQVTFVIDTNPNYTNICDTDCLFCAFARHSKDSDAYTLSVDEVIQKIATVEKKGVTTVLLQGGHNRALRLDYYLSLIRETKKHFPHVTPHFFSASEIVTMAEVEGIGTQDVLCQLWAAGQTSLPGGGAEILSNRVRQRISPKKGGAESWLLIHEQAHQIGMVSTATMMYGHVEKTDDIIEHWHHIRSLQTRSLAEKNGGGFTAFVPWSFKPDNTHLQKKFPRRAGAISYLRILAAARLFLDNIPHVQASWFSEGKKVGQIALQFGADDFGGTLFEENVHAQAGFVNAVTLPEIVALIQQAGFTAVQRTTHYDRCKIFPIRKKLSTELPPRENFIPSFQPSKT